MDPLEHFNPDVDPIDALPDFGHLCDTCKVPEHETCSNDPECACCRQSIADV